jgi:hypothetical protein
VKALAVVTGTVVLVGVSSYALTTREFMGFLVALFVVWLWASTISS